ncbi:MAG: M24 family metallopeptidase, partial [Halanaeroarchaeum sp.]
DQIAPGETVLLDISPRGPQGYYGDLTRTFVVGSDGGWERRAYVAVEQAHEEALAHVEAGVPAGTVHEEAAAELAAHGFRIDSGEVGFTHGVGHGVGVSLHEGPSLRADTPLEPGNVVTIEPGVYDPDIGGVRIEDLVAVTEDGYERLASYPVRFTPVGPA